MGRKLISFDEIDQEMANVVMFEQGDYAESERPLLKRIGEARDDLDRYFLYLSYGEILMQMERWEDARDVLIQSAQIALNRKDDLGLALSHEKLGDLSAAEGNSFGALHHFRYALRKAASLVDHSATEKLESRANAARSTLLVTVLPQDANTLPLSKEYVSAL